jgi:hypothetical protein
MALHFAPKIVTSGLIFYYDMGNTTKSWRGVATTNVHANQVLYTYNNVSANVTATIEATSETYRGATIYKQTLTPINATGVSQLSAGNNPGIGVYTANGGGTANTYTGYSIYFKLGVPGHTSPIFTNYSNVAGYLSSANYNYVGDGWYRGHVIWYDTVTRSDSKYWAINPASATLNVPIVVYWCAPFREDRNDSTFVSPFVNGTRANTASVLDLTNRNTITANSLTYVSDGTFSFNGSTNYITTTNTGMSHGTDNFSYSCWVKFAGLPGLGTIFENGFYTAGILIRFETNVIRIYAQYSTTSYTNAFSFTPTVGQWYHLVITRVGNNLLLYSNGILQSTITFGTSINVVPSNNLMFIGMSQHQAGQCFNGQIAHASVYSKALSAEEVKQNFAAQRGRFGI